MALLNVPSEHGSGAEAPASQYDAVTQAQIDGALVAVRGQDPYAPIVGQHKLYSGDLDESDDLSI